MKKVIIGSGNPVKLEVAKRAFEKVFPNEVFSFEPYSAQSLVSHQPMTDEETLKGARNRTLDCKAHFPEADFWVAQESGVIDHGDTMFETSYIFIESKEGTKGLAKAASFQIPVEIAEHIRKGMELGPAADKFFNVNNSKQEASIIGYLTDKLIDRTDAYYQSAVFALMPHKHKQWY